MPKRYILLLCIIIVVAIVLLVVIPAAIPFVNRILSIINFTERVKDKNYPEELFAYLVTGNQIYLENAKNAIKYATFTNVNSTAGRYLIVASLIKTIDPNFNEIDKIGNYIVEKQNRKGLWNINDEGYCYTSSSSVIVEGLLWAYKITGNDTYLSSALKYLGEVESIRSENDWLIPRIIYLDGTIGSSSPRYYDEMGTHAALHYFIYELTSNQTHYNIALDILNTIVQKYWDGSAFQYQPGLELYEIELSWFDPLLLMINKTSRYALEDLLYRILDANKSNGYEDGTLHGFMVSNNLVKHAVYSNGRDYANNQSLFHVNKAVPIALLYYSVYKSVNLFNNIVTVAEALENHRKSNGYIIAIDPYTYEPDSYNPNPSHSNAFIYSYMLFLSAIKPPTPDALPRHYGGYDYFFFANYSMNLGSKTLYGIFVNGTYTFHFGTKPVNYAFSRKGYYKVVFSNDFNTIVTVVPLDTTLTEIEEPWKYITVGTKENRIIKFSWKARVGHYLSNLAFTGVCIFKREIFSYLDRASGIIQEVENGVIPPQEYDIIDSLNTLIKEGGILLGKRINTWWIDIDYPWCPLNQSDVLLQIKPSVLLQFVLNEGSSSTISSTLVGSSTSLASTPLKTLKIPFKVLDISSSNSNCLSSRAQMLLSLFTSTSFLRTSG